MNATDHLPVFPVTNDAIHQGMSQRDWFAAQALQGIVAKGLDVSGDRVRSEEEKAREMVRQSYCLADAMIEFKQREQQVTPAAAQSSVAEARKLMAAAKAKA